MIRLLPFFSRSHPNSTSTATKTHDAYKMLRFVPFMEALLTLGITAGNSTPSFKGEWILLYIPDKRGALKVVVKPPSVYHVYLQRRFIAVT